MVASLADLAASGGYYLAAGADQIVANPATITGSIGVISQFPELSGLYDKLGISVRTFKSGQFKDIGNVDRSMTDAEIRIVESIINDSYDQFIRAVVDGRGMDENKVRQLADGRIFSGKQAQALGLVDELGNLDKAIDLAQNLSHIDGAQVVKFSDEGFWESFLSSRFGQQLPLAQLLSTTIPNQQFGVYYLFSF